MVATNIPWSAWLLRIGLVLLVLLGWPTLARAHDLETDLGDRCLLAVQQQGYDQAVTLCSQALEIADQNSDYWLSRGLARYHGGDFSQALVDDTQALSLAPENFRVYYNRGLVYVALHDFGAAIADFDQALARAATPEALVEIYDDRGLAKLMAAQPEQALADFDQALALAEGDVRTLFNHSCACHQLGRTEAALVDLNHLLRIDPDHARTYLKRGLLRRSLGDHAGGLADLQQAAHCAQLQGQAPLHHYILTLLNAWQSPALATG